MFARLLRPFWDAYEWAFEKVFRLQRVSASPQCVLRIGPRTHRGPQERLEDGTVVRPGERIAELHLDNRAIRRLRQPGDTDHRHARAFGRAMIHSLRELAVLAQTHPRYSQVPAFFGTSLFYDRAAILGFETREIEWRGWRRALGWYLRGLLGRMHPGGKGRLRAAPRRRQVGIVWMSRARLLERYGSASGGEQVTEGDAPVAEVCEAGKDPGQSSQNG